MYKGSYVENLGRFPTMTEAEFNSIMDTIMEDKDKMEREESMKYFSATLLSGVFIGMLVYGIVDLLFFPY